MFTGFKLKQLHCHHSMAKWGLNPQLFESKPSSVGNLMKLGCQHVSCASWVGMGALKVHWGLGIHDARHLENDAVQVQNETC